MFLNLSAQDSSSNQFADGILSIHNESEGSIRLDGSWKFYWKQFREDIQEDTKFINLPVPSGWTGYSLDDPNETIPAHGYGTYSLQINFDKNIDTSNLGIRLKDFGSSYRAYVNGELIASNGRVGKNKEDYTFDMMPVIAKFPYSPTNEYVLEIEVANFDNTNGGFWNRAYLGNIDTLYQDRTFDTSINYIFFGITTIIGIYSILFFLYVKSFQSSIYFGLFSILLGMRTILTGERVFLDWIPMISFEIIYKAEYLSMYLAIPLFAKYIFNLIPNIFPRILLNTLNSIFFICSLIVVLLPANLYTHTVTLIQPLIILYGILGCYYLLKSPKSHFKDASLLFISLTFMLAATINDILFHETSIKSIILVPYALILFIFLHGILLGRKFASSYVHSKFLASELKTMNLNLEEKIQERTKDLAKKIQIISDDLTMAKNIQDRILGVKSLTNDYFDFQAIYQPIEKLGGDYFDIIEVSNNKFRIIVADATGHGIQAALVTMAIKSEYEYAKFKYKNPNEIIHFLNQQFCIKYKNLRIYFTCVIVDFDCISGKLTLASAGHPNQILVRNSNSVEEIESQGQIIGLSKSSIYKNFSNKVESQETIYMFTDGWVEQYNPHKEMYGEARFYESILKHNSNDLKATLVKIEQDTNEFLSGTIIQDDLALLAIRKK